MILLGIGAFVALLYTTNEAKNNLEAINENAKIKKNHQKVLKQLADYIEYNSQLKKLAITKSDQ